MDRDAFRERSRQSWDAVATGWEAHEEFLHRNVGLVNDWLVTHADPRPGQVVLEVAAGPGDLGHRAAVRVAPGGRVISSDFSAEMVKVAQRSGRSRGLDNVEYRQLDAEKMDLADDSVDVVLCRFGYMLMADPAAALRESRRVLRAGGTLALAVWSVADRNPWAARPGAVLVERGHVPRPEPGTPGVFALGDRDRLADLVTAAGFSAPEVEAIDFPFRYPDDDFAWNSTVELNGTLAGVIGSLSPQEQEATRRAVLDGYAPFRQGDGSYTVPAQAWGVVAR